jgi:hypothetical protein
MISCGKEQFREKENEMQPGGDKKMSELTRGSG